MQQLLLQVTDGREVELGTREDFAAAEREIARATGGSSHRGRFSYLFGLEAREIGSEEADRLGDEAVEFKELFAEDLGAGTIGLLDRLATLRSDDGS